MAFVPRVPDSLIDPSLTVQDFRDILPEFEDASAYTDETIVEWLNIATQSLQPQRWRQLWRLGCSLYIAHNLVLSARNAQAAKRGIPGGLSGGLISSKSMGGVSISYETGTSGLPNAGPWGTTTYGQRFLDMVRMIGSGGIQVTGVPPVGAIIVF